MKRSEVMAHRIRAQQLDRAVAERAFTDADIFDFGVQDTGRDGASWALANRGVPVSGTEELEGSPDVALAWTLRSSPHYYRRSELWDVMVAASPFSDADAVKRDGRRGQAAEGGGHPGSAGTGRGGGQDALGGDQADGQG